ncbi:MAG: DNA-processing protein DprA [Opitutaceae bacterium]
MAVELTRRQAFMVLNGLPSLGPVTLKRLLDAFDDDPVAVLAARPADLRGISGVGPVIGRTIEDWPTHFRLDREEKKLETSGARFLTREDKDYPVLLKEIHDPPIGLYSLGNYTWAERAIAIVGSRRCTLYGQAVARRFGAELARAGFCVFSGLARGIDTAAHEGALGVKGGTAAVLGCGLDIIYPAENLDLYRKIGESGIVLSEFPFGRRADRQSFPMRNRVVAGSCQAVVVIESDLNGGSMITARFSGEQGRMIFAVPGRIDQASSRGCHALIRDGATLVTSVDEILEEFSYLGGMRPLPIGAAGGGVTARPELDGDESALYACFRGGSILNIDTMVGLTGLPLPAVSAALMSMELKRVVRKRADGCFEACP